MSPERVKPGAIVDGFRIGEPLHEGGQGVLYAVERASGDGDGFPLLMKVPRLGPGQPGESVTTYEVERMVLSALEGRHVPRFVAAGDLESQPYLVQERVEGRSLAEFVGPLPAAEVARLGAATARALQALHAQGGIHLDVKPSNVIVRPDGEAVLIDFGLSRHLRYPDLLGEEAHAPVGSAPYVSPEGVLGIRNDPRSDLFSLGVLLYELATGELPYGAPTSAGGLRQRLWIDPLPPRARVPDVPEWLQEVILRCLEPDPAERYPSAAAVADDLERPEQVLVTDRGRRLRSAGSRRRMSRWLRQMRYGQIALGPAPERGTRVVLVAIATQHTNEERNEALRAEARRLVRAAPDTRLACVAVIRPASDPAGAALGATSQRIRHLVLLRHWTEGLDLGPGQVTHHVIESGDAAEALLDYARRNHVDQVLIGAP
ncbi:MAG TPA: protein kinase, partial [Anaeromyxobacter sp.]|nr:protein kinase [Anaeromyxobacter sp.]